jgi:hypothetical protein
MEGMTSGVDIQGLNHRSGSGFKQVDYGSGLNQDGSKSGSGCDSNASTLKALPLSLREQRESLAREDVGDDHVRQLSLLSEQGSAVETPSPHSSPSRTASALSLDPEVSSTGSGYAATGSTSSVDTTYRAPGSTSGVDTTPNTQIKGSEHSTNHIHTAMLAGAGPRDGHTHHRAETGVPTPHHYVTRPVARDGRDILMYQQMVFGNDETPENFTIDV